MRPIHALLVVLALAGLAGGAAWFVLREGRPGSDRPAAPISGAAVAEQEARAEVARPRETASESGEREVLEVAPAEPAEPAGADARGASVVAGRVTAADGSPVEGARVLGAASGAWSSGPIDEVGGVFGPRPRETVTAADGRFELTGLRAGPVRLAVRASGFAPWDGAETVLPAGTERLEVEPIVLEEGVVLEGHVVDGAGRPVAGASLERFTPGSGFAVLGARTEGPVVAETAADGSFRVDELAAGPWALLVRSAAHPTKLARGTTAAPGEVVRDLAIELDPGEEITGRVVGLPEGGVTGLAVRAAPVVEGVRSISLDGFDPRYEVRVADVASDGTFRLRGLVIDRSYRLSALQGAGDAPRDPFGRSVSPPVEARAGQRNVELPWQPESVLTCRVVDATTGAPVTQMDVRAGVRFALPVRDENGRARSEFPDGRVRAGDLRPRENERVRLAIDAVGYEPYRRDDIAVRAGQEVDLGTIRLAPAPVLTVEVLERATGEPIEGADVRLSEVGADPATEGPGGFSIEIDAGQPGGLTLSGGTHAVTDGEGRARLSSRPGRLCKIEVSASDHAPAAVQVELPAGGAHTEVVELGSGGTVELSVVDTDGRPLAGERVRHRGPAQSELPDFMLPAGLVTGEDGRVVVEHLEPGTHAFALAGDEASMVFMQDGAQDGAQERVAMRLRGSGGVGGAPDPWSEVDVTEGGRQELQLVAPLRLTLSGRVLEAGIPLAGAALRLEPPGEEDGLGLPGPFGPSGPTTRTDGNGHYELAGVEAGDWVLVIEHETRQMPARRELTLARGSERFDVDLPVSIVEGTVRGPDGPLEGISVHVEEAGSGPQRQVLFVTAIDDGSGTSFSAGGLEGGAKSVVTDTRGRFSLRGVRPGVSLVVAAQGPGYTPAKSEPFVVDPDAIVTGADVSMYAGGSLEVRVVDSSGAPVGQVLLRLSYDGEEYPDVQPKTTIAGASGVAKVDGLVPGVWKIRATRLGLGSVDLDAGPVFEGRVVEKEERPVTIELPD